MPIEKAIVIVLWVLTYAAIGVTIVFSVLAWRNNVKAERLWKQADQEWRRAEQTWAEVARLRRERDTDAQA